MADSFLFFLIQLLNGVQYGLLLFLVASGLTLIFGIMGIINLAHGSFYMIGAYLAFSLSSSPAVCGWRSCSACRCRVAARPGARDGCCSGASIARDHLYQVLLTYGLILVFEELRSLARRRRRARRRGAGRSSTSRSR